MAKRKIFVSYDYDNDRRYKYLLLAWDTNGEFDFAMSDQSADVSIQSYDAAAIKRAISAKINSATRFLCIIGSETSTSAWVAWEIEKAKELKKSLIAVKVSSTYTTPSGLLGSGATWAMSFTFDAIKKAIDGS